MAINPPRIALKFGTEFDHSTAQMFKVKGQGHKVKVQGHSLM